MKASTLVLSSLLGSNLLRRQNQSRGSGWNVNELHLAIPIVHQLEGEILPEVHFRTKVVAFAIGARRSS